MDYSIVKGKKCQGVLYDGSMENKASMEPKNNSFSIT